MNDFLTIHDTSRDELEMVLDRAAAFRQDPFAATNALANRVVVELFAKPSTRTRLSIAAAVARLGGRVEVVSGADLQLGRGETIEDTARVISRYASAFVIRTHDHGEIERFADAATIPVINALSAIHHPLQALADIATIRDRFGPSPVDIAYVGDGNNVAHSLAEICAALGYRLRIATPFGRECADDIIKAAQHRATDTGGSILTTTDPVEAVSGADVVYADVWQSMGQEDVDTHAVFHDYQVNTVLMSHADSDAVFMHCLPAHRGEEVTDEVIDSTQSIVLDQAEFRMHTVQALLVSLIQQ